MKEKWPALVLAMLMLCGCSGPNEGESAPAESTMPTLHTAKPTEPVGFYAPESPLELATDGAVKTFPLSVDHAWGIRFLGEDIVLFSGHDVTTLTLLSGEARYIRAQVQLPCPVSPDDPAVTVSQRGLTYVDRNSRMLVFLNNALEEVSRIPLPEGCGDPVLSADRRMLYYCSADALRVLDLETGLDRLLKEMSFPCQELTGLHCNDTVLQCSVMFDDGGRRTLFLSVQDGSLLHEAAENIPFWTSDDFYFTAVMDGEYQELITGSRNSAPAVLVINSEPEALAPVPDQKSILIYSLNSADSTVLDFYQLEDGIRTAQVTLPGMGFPRSVHSDSSGSTLWFLCTDSATGQDTLCAWNPAASAVEDEETYLQPRYSRENPDLDGLEQCSTLARRISVKHDVQILIWTEAAAFQPWDYELVPEYQVPLIRRRLEELDEILSCYPAGFLEKAASQTGNGRLSICLVRSINGKPDTGALDSAVGLQFWDQDARAYLAITLGHDMAQHIYHELFHIIDSRVLSSCSAYDSWNDLNPKDFSYDSGYASGNLQKNQDLITGENRYFIDRYSMSYPKEDRARIMEYAMLEGHREDFQSAPMQAKLRTLCLGIREAFGLEGEPVIYRWEQYLQSPLAPVK